MTRKLHRSIRGLGVLAALAGGTFFSHAAMAADNYFLPHSIQNWAVPGNWSLGHCPLQTEDVHIEVTDSDPMYVIYDWTGASGFGSVTIDGDGPTNYGAIYQPDLWLDTAVLKMSLSGDAYYQMEDDAYLTVNEYLYVGYFGTHTAHFTMDTNADPAAGLSVGDLFYVGYNAPGEFNHQAGYAEVYRLYVGQNDAGTYTLSGTEAGSQLTLNHQFVVGNAEAGTFEQEGGMVDQTAANGLMMGFNTGGVGTYNMSGGQLNVDHISLAFNGDAYFNHTGGMVTTDDNIIIGCDGTHPMRAWYKMADTDGDPELYVGGDLKIGQYSVAKFEQNSGGTIIVDGDIGIWKGTADADYSYLYLGLDADWMEAAQVTNHSGYYDQDGGTVSTPSLTNDSTYGINIDNNADLRATTVEHNAGTFYTWRNAQLRGQYAGGGVYNLCNFTNNATFQMGNTVFDGGTFFGTLTNHGTFNYYQGDFTESQVINHGTVNLYADLHCRRFVNNENFTLGTGRWIYADGVGYPSEVENNGGLIMQPDSHFDVGYEGVLVNKGEMYAGGPGSDYAHIFGNVVNYGYLLPSPSYLPSARLYINGNFTALPGAELRIRIHGTDPDDHDRLAVQNVAALDGKLNVKLTDGFVPGEGDSFLIVGGSQRFGEFSPVLLPELPDGLAWQLDYDASSLYLNVVSAAECPADITGDGVVDVLDLLEVLSQWGGSGSADITGDGIVDVLDLLEVLGAWGECP